LIMFSQMQNDMQNGREFIITFHVTYIIT